MGNDGDGTGLFTVLTCVLWALKDVPIPSISLSYTNNSRKHPSFPSRIRINPENTSILIFSPKLCIQYSQIIHFNFSIYKAYSYNSPKGRITCEGRLNLRLPRDCMLCNDLGDDDNARVGHVRRKRTRTIGQNIRLDRLHAHMRTFHPDACRFEARSLFSMGFTTRELALQPLRYRGLMDWG